MKDRPILMSAPNPCALLAGTKSQTRRTMKLPLQLRPDDLGIRPVITEHMDLAATSFDLVGRACPYGVPGDLLYVRESCWIYGQWHKNGTTKTGRQKWRFRPVGQRVTFEMPGVGEVTWYGGGEGFVWRPSIHMPRWASRLTLRITDVRVQQLQDISEEDAIAEGIDLVGAPFGIKQWRDYLEVGSVDLGDIGGVSSPISSYRSLWTLINGAGSWDANPYVWALTFEVIKQNLDRVMEAQRP